MTSIASLEPLVNVRKLKSIDINKNQFILGRLPSCDHVFADLRSSSKHAIIIYNPTNKSFILQDNATNGTFVNNKKIGKGNKVSLKHNDQIAFVRTRLEFKFNVIQIHPISPQRNNNSSMLSLDPLADTQINNNSISPLKQTRKRKQEEWRNDDNGNNNTDNRNNTNNSIKADNDSINVPPKKKRKLLNIDDDIVSLIPLQEINSFDLFNDNNNNNNNNNNKEEEEKEEKEDVKEVKMSKIKNPKRMRASDVRNLEIEAKSGLFDGVIALMIAKKSRRLDIIMEKFIENGGEMYDEMDVNDNYDLIKDINTIIMNKTMPYIKLKKIIKDESIITKFHVVTLDFISDSMQHKKILNTRKYIPKCLKNNNAINIKQINKSKCPAKQSMDIDDDDDNDENDEDYDIKNEIEEKASEQHSDNEEEEEEEIDNDIISKSKEKKDDLIIEQIEDKLLIIKHKEWKSSLKIAAFDMDGTLILTQSGNKFARNYKDFRLIYDYTNIMEEKLNKYHCSGYSFVIFSNQKISHLKHKKPAVFHEKLSDIKKKVPLIMKEMTIKQSKKLIPFVFMAALNDDIFRKPHCGMFEYFNKNINYYQETQLDKKSFFVGDAAGREKGWKNNGRSGNADFSSSDRAFAINCKLTFYSPEEFWLNANKCKKFRLLDLETIIKKGKQNKYPEELININNSEPEMILFIGYPGCGKTTLYQKFFYIYNYQHINRDTLGSMEKCESFCKHYLQEKKSVVIDNTNPSKIARKRFIQIAKTYKIKIRCIWMQIDKALAHHLNVMRWRMDNTKQKIPVQAYKKYDKEFNKPQKLEGFHSIIITPFVFDETLQSESQFLLHT